MLLLFDKTCTKMTIKHIFYLAHFCIKLCSIIVNVMAKKLKRLVQNFKRPGGREQQSHLQPSSFTARCKRVNYSQWNLKLVLSVWEWTLIMLWISPGLHLCETRFLLPDNLRCAANVSLLTKDMAVLMPGHSSGKLPAPLIFIQCISCILVPGSTYVTCLAVA